jgi:hypothetical protein
MLGLRSGQRGAEDATGRRALERQSLEPGASSGRPGERDRRRERVGAQQRLVHQPARAVRAALEWTEVVGSQAVDGGGGYIGGLGTWHYNGHSWTKFGGVANGIEGGSALSASNIWATGSIHSPGDSLAHYNGTRWSRVSAPALKNAQFNDIVAVSRGNVWAVGEPAGSITSGLVVHWDGRRWRKIAVPWQVQPRSVISDGQGGLWMTASSGSSGPGQVSWVLHRSKSGRWTRTRISTGAPGGLNDLALDPGTHAVWGAGDAATKAGSDAVIFADGRVS